MDFLVGQEVSRLSESLVAFFAYVRFLLGVCPLMNLECALS